MSKQNQMHIATVEWTSPQGQLAPFNKKLSLGEYDGSTTSQDFPFLAFALEYEDCGNAMYL